jgi:hypothetical protein
MLTTRASPGSPTVTAIVTAAAGEQTHTVDHRSSITGAIRLPPTTRSLTCATASCRRSTSAAPRGLRLLPTTAVPCRAHRPPSSGHRVRAGARARAARIGHPLQRRSAHAAHPGRAASATVTYRQDRARRAASTASPISRSQDVDPTRPSGPASVHASAPFTPERYGDAGYAQLHRSCAPRAAHRRLERRGDGRVQRC